MKFSFLPVPALLLLLLLLLPAPRASGAEPVSAECRRLYQLWDEGQLSPVSPYTQAVLERARAGIARAGTLDAESDFSGYLPHWALNVQRTWGSFLDAQLRLEARQESLLAETACLRFDQLLIECALEETRLAIREQFARGSISGIEALQSLLSFLNERLRHLSRGALDPLYEDPSFSLRYRFDPPAETGALIVPPPEPPVCPYHSDYVPPFPSGYGCDVSVLEPRATFAPLRAELEAQRMVEEQTDAYRDSARAVLGLQQELDAIFGRDSALPPPPPDRTHRTAFGCGWTGGLCLENHAVRCTGDDECSDAGAGGTCALSTGVCSENRVRRCLDDGDCEGAGLCVADDAGLPPSRSLRGSFSLEPDELQILKDFLDLRTEQELSRAFGTDARMAEEFGGQTPERAAREREDTNLFTRGLRAIFRGFFQVVSRIQGTREAPLFARTVDPQRRVAASLAPLQESVSRIARLAHDPDGLRGFVIRYATFLRRTCIHRPCNSVLDRVLKTAFSDECFPYTNGAFLTDTPDNPRWRQCRSAIDAH